MRTFVLFVMVMIATPVATSAGQPTTDRQARVAALKAVRDDLPEVGPIALAAKEESVTSEETALAIALGIEARPLSSLRECVPSLLKTGRRDACTLRGAVGALRVERVQSTGDNSMRVHVLTIVPMTAKDIAPWLYSRWYAVDLIRRKGVWQVVGKQVTIES